jgi:hypothetical protein
MIGLAWTECTILRVDGANRDVGARHGLAEDQGHQDPTPCEGGYCCNGESTTLGSTVNAIQTGESANTVAIVKQVFMPVL